MGIFYINIVLTNLSEVHGTHGYVMVELNPQYKKTKLLYTLVMLHEHYKASHDVEYLETNLYNPYIRRVANFLCKYRDKKTGLPLPSHDLWEEQFGTFTYTASSVYAGLIAAADFAGTLGKEVAKRRWQTAAEEVKEGILTKMIHTDGRVMKSLRYTHFSPEADYTADASSFYGLFHFGVLDVDDPVSTRHMSILKIV